MPSPPDALPLVLRRLRQRFFAAHLADALFVALAAGVTIAVGAHGVGFDSLLLTAFAASIAGAFAWRAPPDLAGVAVWLDTRHGLTDLLGSAWATRDRRDEPWAAALWQSATCRVTALPPTDRLTRFAPRHYACVAAAGVALWLAGDLVRPTASGSPGAATAGVAVDRPDVRQTAAVVRRRRDTASSEGPLPGPAEKPAGPPGRTPARPSSKGDRSDGAGRADSDALSALPPSAGASDVPAGIRSAAGGPGRAAAGGAGPAAAARVRSTVGRQSQSALPTDARPASDGNGPPKATAVPADYRDLVRDFFAR